jgi:methylthioribose-1-phosphate isomerase
MNTFTPSPLQPVVHAVNWREGSCVLLDQRKLPREETYLECRAYEQVVDAIKTLTVRGAPAIGIAGAYAVALAAEECLRIDNLSARSRAFENALNEISSARPTAVNLKWAVDRVAKRVGDNLDVRAAERILEEAHCIHREDILCNQQIAAFGASLIPADSEIITYCNTGDLATGGIGTALGVVKEAYRLRKVSRVYPCETRPVMQGMRLTTWECQRNGIPFSLICDNMAAAMMRRIKTIRAAIVGADRIAANGDVANKVGTYALAIAAKYHEIPFYVAAPSSTFDLQTETGAFIPIEDRSPEELVQALGENRPSFPMGSINPSFDVTPAELITAIICEKGIISPPSKENVSKILG